MKTFMSRTPLFKRNVIQGTNLSHICNFQCSRSEVEMEEKQVNALNNAFYLLTCYIKNIISKFNNI